MRFSLPSEEGTTETVLRTFARKPRPEPGPDCHTCAEFFFFFFITLASRVE